MDGARTAIRAVFSGGESQHCVFMFRIAVPVPHDDHSRASAFDESENGPSPGPCTTRS